MCCGNLCSSTWAQPASSSRLAGLATIEAGGGPMDPSGVVNLTKLMAFLMVHQSGGTPTVACGDLSTIQMASNMGHQLGGIQMASAAALRSMNTALRRATRDGLKQAHPPRERVRERREIKHHPQMIVLAHVN